MLNTKTKQVDELLIDQLLDLLLGKVPQFTVLYINMDTTPILGRIYNPDGSITNIDGVNRGIVPNHIHTLNKMLEYVSENQSYYLMVCNYHTSKYPQFCGLVTKNEKE